jgi:hydrogenase/urease accessory protein HupE
MCNKAFRELKAIQFLKRAWGLLFFFSSAFLLFAHDPGLSLATARFGASGLNVRLVMSPTDVQFLIPIDANHDGAISPEELAVARPQLEPITRSAFVVKQGHQNFSATEIKIKNENAGAVQFELFYPGSFAGELTIQSRILDRLARGHRQFLSVRDWENKLLGEAMLEVTHDSYAVALALKFSAPVGQHSFKDFLGLGIIHIATGYDHILFLLGLLMVGGSFKSVLKIITAFTIAHSLTLVLATMNFINISPSIIEPLIAVSIIYVGVENLLRRNLDQRWLLAFGFGLVHGCGFATALRDLGIGSDGTRIFMPLLAFNLGVEICQMTLAALLLPVIWKLRERPQFVRRLIPVGSCLIALAGTWWLLQRTLC